MSHLLNVTGRPSLLKLSLQKSLERDVDATERYYSCAREVLIHLPSTCADLIAFCFIAFHNQIDSLVSKCSTANSYSRI